MSPEAYSWFTTGLRDLGWVEGRNVVFERRFSMGRVEELSSLAAELVNAKLDAIVTVGSPAAIALKALTQTVPIVFTRSGDPVGLGLVASLARPGGNLTGLSIVLVDLATKKVELLREAVPGLKRLGVLWSPVSPAGGLELKEVERAASSFNIELQRAEWRTHDDWSSIISTMSGRVEALYLGAGPPPSVQQRSGFAEVAVKAGLATMTGRKESAEAGALMSYAPDYSVMFRRAAVYVDKILRGAKPADLPVEQPTKFELVINLKTAKALGLDIPPSVYARADEVIE
jgi:putative ABC transport system substrate-binding protein